MSWLRAILLAFLLCACFESCLSATVDFSPSRPATLYVGQRLQFTVTLSSAPSAADLTLTITRIAGTGTVSLADGSTSVDLIWPRRSTISNTFVITAPQSTGSGTFKFTMTGTNAASYTALANSVITWVSRNSFTVGSVSPSLLYTGQTSNTITVTPSAAVGTATTITIGATGTTTMVFTPSMLSFNAGSSAARTFTLVDTSSFGTFGLTFTIGGAGEPQWNQINNIPVVIAERTGAFMFEPALPSYLFVSTTRTMSVSLNGAATVTLALSASGTGAASPSSLAFTTSTVSRSLTLTSSGTVGNLVISFTVTGTDAARFAPPTQATIRVRAKPTLTSDFTPSQAIHTQFFTSQTMRLTLSNDLGADLVDWVGVLVTGTIGAIPVFVHQVNFTAPNAPITIEPYTAPALWTSGQTSMTVSFILSGPDSVNFVSPASVAFTLATQSTIQLTYTPTLGAGLTGIAQVRLNYQPPSTAATVSIQVQVDRAADVSPSTLTFTRSTWSALQTVSIVAPTDSLLPMVLRVELGGPYGVAYRAPDPVEIELVSSFLVSPSSIDNLLRVYRWPAEPPVDILIRGYPATPTGDDSSDDITVAMTTSTNRAVAAAAVTFPFGSTEQRSVWFRQHTSSTTETIQFAVTGSDKILPPLSISVQTIPYPSNVWGPNATPCACSSSGTSACSTGWWGTGECTCKTGFTGETCNACLPGYATSSCKACACVYGDCNDGMSKSGSCSCQPYWSGSTCSTASSSRLLPKMVTATCIQGQSALVTFSATITSPAFGTTILTLPQLGTLYTTTDGTTRGAAITAVPFTIARTATQRVIYLPPSDGGLPPNSDAYATFNYRVSSANQDNSNNFATVTLILNQLNTPPIIQLDPTITLNSIEAQPTSGTIFGRQNQPVAINLFNASDPRAIDTAQLILTLSVPTGGIEFNFPRTTNPALLARIAPAPSSVMDFTYSTRTLTITAIPSELNELILALAYRPVTDFVGTETITLTLQDRGASGVTASGAVDTAGFTVTATIDIFIQRLNQQIRFVPGATFLASLAASEENQDISLPASLTDADAFTAATISIRLSAVHGSFLSGATRLSNGAPTVGTIDAINAMLAKLIYRPDTYYSGPDTITVNCTDGQTEFIGGPTWQLRTFPFTIADVEFPPVADNKTIAIQEDSYVIVTLSGTSLDDNTTSLLQFDITQLPDSSCMVLFQFDSVSGRRGAPLTDTPPNNRITSSTNQLFARMVYGSRATITRTKGCPFSYSSVKPSGSLSLPATIAFNLTHLQNHPPIAIDQDAYAVFDVDRLITLQASDADGDNITYSLESMPADPASQLFQAVPISGGHYERGALITDTGVELIDGRVFFHSGTTRVSSVDSFRFGSFDSPLGSFGPASFGTVRVVVEPLVDTRCVNLTLLSNTNAPLVAIDFQSSGLSATGRGISEVRIETALDADTGSLHRSARDDTGAQVLGDTIGVGSTIAIDASRDPIGQPLVFLYQPPAGRYGSPLATFTYSCTSLQGIASHSLGHVTLIVNRVNQPPVVPSELTFASIPYPGGLTNIALLQNVSDPDIDIDSPPAALPEAGRNNITIRILTLPKLGVLRQSNGAIISTVPYWLTDDPLNRLHYIPNSGLTPPFYDTWRWSAFDGLLSSSSCLSEMIVGADRLPPRLTADVTGNITTYEGGVAARVMLRYTVTEPKNLGGIVTVAIAQPPTIGYLTTSTGELPTAGSVLHSSTSLSVSIYYVPPVTRPLNVLTDTFTLSVTDSSGLRSDLPDLPTVIHILRLNQPPRGFPSNTIGEQDTPIKVKLNFTTFGTIADLRVTLQPTWPNQVTQGKLYACSPEEGRWRVAPTNQTHVNMSTISLTPGCDGEPDAIAVIFVPATYFYTLSTDDARRLPSASISFMVHDGSLLSSGVATATVDLRHVIYPPWAIPIINATVARRSDATGALLLTLTGADLEDDNILTAQINSLPSHGELFQVHPDTNLAAALITGPTDVIHTGGRVLYVPHLYYHGVDTFLFQVAQLSLPGAQTSPEVSVSIRVSYRDIPPFFESNEGRTVNASQNTPQLIKLPNLVAITNPDDAALTYIISKIPILGDLFQLLPSYTAATPESDLLSHLGLSLTLAPAVVTHPSGWIVFVPEPDQLGIVAQGYLYTSMVYAASSGDLRTATDISISINLMPVYQPPRVGEATRTVDTRENFPVVIQLAGTVDTTFADAAYDVIISRLPEKGIVCQMLEGSARVANADDAPCGIDYGAQLVFDGAKLVDRTLHRVVYLPPLNGYGLALDSFEYRIQDSLRVLSVLPGSIVVDVEFVNQPPFIRPGVTLEFEIWSRLQTDIATLTPTRIDLREVIGDPDDTFENITYTIIQPPKLGELMEVIEIDTMVASPLRQNESTVSYPYTLPSPVLYYHPRGSGGAPNPYSLIPLRVSDPAGLTIELTLILLANCASSLFPNIWTSAANKGALCKDCPTNALCSSQGIFMPVSQPGAWRSSYLNEEGEPIYIKCKIQSSCVSTPYDASAMTTASDNSSTTLSPVQSLSTIGCAAGFAGRMCAECAAGYYVRGRDCIVCPSSDSASNTLDMVGLLMSILIPLVTVGLGVLWVLKKRLKVDLSFVAILLTFFQTTSSFKEFPLNWPGSNTSIFDKLGFVSFNFDILSLECSIPSLEFTTKWLAYMLLPVVAGGVLTVGACIGTLACVAYQYAQLRFRPESYNSPTGESTPVDRVDATGAKYQLPAANDEMSSRASKVKTRPRTFVGLCSKWLIKLSATAFGLFILFCDFIYLPLALKAMNMLACTDQADGTRSLDYQPSLRCDEPWHQDTWSKIGICCLVIYGIGIPLLYTFIFFHLRPAVQTYPPAFIPSAWLPDGKRAWCLCPRGMNKRLWRQHVLRDKRESINTHAAEDLNNYILLQRWRATFLTLVQPFRVSKYFWSVMVISRSFLISICASFMLNAPVYQCALILLVLACALTLQLTFRPYKFHIKYSLNTLETTSLISQAVIITCGMIFYLASRSHPELMGDNVDEDAYRYPLFRMFLSAIIYTVMLIVTIMACSIFVIQIQFRLKYDRGWRESRARAALEDMWSKAEVKWRRIRHAQPTHDNDKYKPTDVCDGGVTRGEVVTPATGTVIGVGHDSDLDPVTRLAHKSLLTGGTGIEESNGSQLQIITDGIDADTDAEQQHRTTARATKLQQHNNALHHEGGANISPDACQPSVTPDKWTPIRTAQCGELSSPAPVCSVTTEPAAGVANPSRPAPASDPAAAAAAVVVGDVDHDADIADADEKNDIVSDAPGDSTVTPNPAAPKSLAHTRLKSTIWRPPTISADSPLRALDQKSLYTHARYMSLQDFSMRQILEINDSAGLIESGQQFQPLDEEDEDEMIDSHTPIANSPSPQPDQINPATGRATPTDHLNPQSVLRSLRPKVIPGVDLGRPYYGRWFKPPPPAGLFIKRIANAAKHLAQLKTLFRRGDEFTSSSDDSDDSDSATGADFRAYHANVKRHRHLRQMTFLVGAARFRDVVHRLILRRAHARRLGLSGADLDPELGVAKCDLALTHARLPIAHKSNLPNRVRGETTINVRTGPRQAQAQSKKKKPTAPPGRIRASAPRKPLTSNKPLKSAASPLPVSASVIIHLPTLTRPQATLQPMPISRSTPTSPQMRPVTDTRKTHDTAATAHTNPTHSSKKKNMLIPRRPVGSAGPVTPKSVPPSRSGSPAAGLSRGGESSTVPPAPLTPPVPMVFGTRSPRTPAAHSPIVTGRASPKNSLNAASSGAAGSTRLVSKSPRGSIVAGATAGATQPLTRLRLPRNRLSATPSPAGSRSATATPNRSLQSSPRLTARTPSGSRATPPNQATTASGIFLQDPTGSQPTTFRL